MNDDLEGTPVPDVLSRRQLQVLILIANGSSTSEIARLLLLSVKTIGAHRNGLMHRLRIFNIAGLTRYAIRHGLVER